MESSLTEQALPPPRPAAVPHLLYQALVVSRKNGIISFRKHLYQLAGIGQLRGISDLPARGIFIAPPQVITDGAAKQDIFLQNHCHLISQGLKPILLHIPSLPGDLWFLRI